MRSDYYVYQWRNLVNGKCYIGKGLGPRALAHLRPSRGSVVTLAVAKYGRENFELTYVATELTEEAAFSLECKLIKERNTKAPHGYNRTDGGEGASGHRWTEEAKRLKSERAKGRVSSPEAVAKIAAWHRGRKRPPSTCKLISEAKRGVKPNISPETRQRMSDNRKGKRQSEETCRRKSEKRRQRGAEWETRAANSRRKINEAMQVNVKLLTQLGATKEAIAEWLGISRASVQRIRTRPEILPCIPF